MRYETLRFLKEETYRSMPFVNITDNWVRVTLTCSRNEWNHIKTPLDFRRASSYSADEHGQQNVTLS